MNLNSHEYDLLRYCRLSFSRISKKLLFKKMIILYLFTLFLYANRESYPGYQRFFSRCSDEREDLWHPGYEKVGFTQKYSPNNILSDQRYQTLIL